MLIVWRVTRAAAGAGKPKNDLKCFYSENVCLYTGNLLNFFFVFLQMHAFTLKCELCCQLTLAAEACGTWLRGWGCGGGGGVLLWAGGLGRFRICGVSGLSGPPPETCRWGGETFCRLMAASTAWNRTLPCLVSNSKLPSPESHLRPASKEKVAWKKTDSSSLPEFHQAPPSPTQSILLKV